MPHSFSCSATSMPSPPYISMMFAPPGAMTTAAPLRLPSGGRNNVRNGASSGPLPWASGTWPGAHSGMLTFGGVADAARVSAAGGAITRAAARKIGLSMGVSLCRDRGRLSIDLVPPPAHGRATTAMAATSAAPQPEDRRDD